MINTFIATLASCPYFIVFTGIYSIASVFTLSILLRHVPGKIKPEISKEDALKVVQCLIETLPKRKHYSFLAALPDSLPPQVRINQVDLANSFQILTSNQTLTYLIKIKSTLYLFGCVDYADLFFKCITTNLVTPELNTLFEMLTCKRIVNTHDFVEQFVKKIS